MKASILLITCLLLIQCNNNCPECEVCQDCPECPELPVIDSVQICNLCFENYMQRANDYWDSLKTTSYAKIDSLHAAAFEEVTEYREQSIYQVDTMRENYLIWCADTLQGINDFFDSLKNTVIYDNMIIYSDSTKASGAAFDSVTGKPYLIFK